MSLGETNHKQNNIMTKHYLELIRRNFDFLSALSPYSEYTESELSLFNKQLNQIAVVLIPMYKKSYKEDNESLRGLTPQLKTIINPILWDDWCEKLGSDKIFKKALKDA